MTNPRTSLRAVASGFSLIELMVVMGVISILIALALPAVNAAREAARRGQCQNNLRQLAIALNAYHDKYNCFPIAHTSRHAPPDEQGLSRILYCGYFSIHARLLPELEQRNLYDSINFTVGTCPPRMGFHRTNPEEQVVNAINATVSRTGLSFFLCPSDSWSFNSGTNYRGNVGVGVNPLTSFLHPDSGNGLFMEIGMTRAADVRDGMSHTVAFSERLLGSGHHRLDPSRDFWAGRTGSPGTADDLIIACRISARPGQNDAGFAQGGETWFWRGRQWTIYNHAQVPNGIVPDCLYGAIRPPPGMATARSFHPGGVNAAMADGSVRFVSETMAQAVWRGLGTRNGGELVD